MGRRATTTGKDIVKTRAAEVFETAAFEVDVLSIAQFHGSIGTSEPSLVVEFVVIGTVYLRTQFIGFRQIHTRLQRHMSFL